MNKKFTILAFFVFIITLTNVLAIVITPVDKEVLYVANMEDSCGFSMKSNLNTVISFRITGDLNYTVKLSKNSITVERDKWYSLECSFKMPQQLTPGPHEINIVSMEGTPPGGGVSAIAGVVYPITVFVPYPGKYLEILKFKADNIKVNDTQEFTIGVVSRGSETLSNIVAVVDVYDSVGKIATVTSQSITLSKGERADLIVKWDSTNSEPGIYTAKVTIPYDNEKYAKAESNFKVGQIRIDIKDIKFNEIKRKSIAKFNLDLQSLWNSQINDAFISLTVFNSDNKQIAEVKGENFVINPWEKQTKQLFWDVKETPAGHYRGNFTVFHSEGRASEKQIEFDVAESYLEGYQLMSVLLVIIVILLLILLFKNIKRNRKKYEKYN